MAGPAFTLKSTDRLGRLTGAVRRELRKVVKDTTEDIAKHAKNAINNGEKTGRIYREETEVSFTAGEKTVSFTAYRGSEKVHQASAPGEAPAADTDTLSNSIQTSYPSALTGEVTVGAEYAAPLEFGSEENNLAPRPFLGPAFSALEDVWPERIAAGIARAAEGTK